ncbi:hypothetical protein I316_03411 [Kwoniella heveanensis BCC8398]|uniref:Extracellular membrane protein CFEM domain-containing protein n=1 Tax=Kwoniella heveanensis BCC8398 TaxID=1296120 RepID=A0A1B9GVD1_9TREE|nr:hypothetical protein I316_03411 [Kwoniella heveanensis BCC8398]
MAELGVSSQNSVGLLAFILPILASIQALAHVPPTSCSKTTFVPLVTLPTASTKTCRRPPYSPPRPSSVIAGVQGSHSWTWTSAASSAVVTPVDTTPSATETVPSSADDVLSSSETVSGGEYQDEIQGVDKTWVEPSSSAVIEVEQGAILTSTSSIWGQEQEQTSTSDYYDDQDQNWTDASESYNTEAPTITSEPAYIPNSETQSLPSTSPGQEVNTYASEGYSSEAYDEEDQVSVSDTSQGTEIRESVWEPASSTASTFEPPSDDLYSSPPATPLSSPADSPAEYASASSQPPVMTTSPPATSNAANSPPFSPTMPTSSAVASPSSSADSSLSAVYAPDGNGTTNCTAPGGGCVLFLTYIAECTTDACACNLTYPAQVCAQCIASDRAVEEYNSFLYACKAKGFVQPSQTIDVECKETGTISAGEGDSTEGENGQLQGIFAIPGNETNIQAIQSNNSPSKVGVSLTAEQSTALEHLGGSNVSESVVAAVQTDENGHTIPLSGYLTDMTGGLISPTGSVGILSATGSAGGALSSQALNSTHAFFETAIEPGCEYQCADWLDLAQSCTDDTCICTTEALGSASACSACIGQKGEINETGRMSVYSEYASSCRSIQDPFASSSVSGLGANGALAAIGITSGSSPTAPPSATISKSGIISGAANPFITDSDTTTKRKGTVTAEEVNGIATVTLGPDNAASRIESPLGAGLMSLAIAAVLIVVA